jgi:ubiquinone/menaquinone biosynthesis C-methylase UbiE
MELKDRYYLKIAAAFVRGKLQQPNLLFQKELDELNEEEQEQLFHIGKAKGFKMHRFKRTMGLPRVEKVLGILQGIQPQNILDIGTGRGVFLFPFVETFPETPITTTDILDYRIEVLEAIKNGGWQTLNVEQQEAGKLNFKDNQFDIVTVLEVLEHIPELEKAIQDICRVAARYVVLSVPSKEDDNPEHIHLLDTNKLTELFKNAGAKSVKFEYYVRNHLIGLVML